MVAISSSQKKTAFAVVLLALIAVGVMISGRGGFSGLRSDAFNNPSFVCTVASLMSGEVRYNGTTATLQNLSTEKAGLQTKIQGWNADIRKNEISIKKLEREKAAAEKRERALEVAVKKQCTPRALATCAAKKKELQDAKQDIRQAQNSLVSAKAKSNTLRTNIQSAESNIKLLEKQIQELQNFKEDYETCKKALEKEKTEVSSFDLIVSGEVFVNEPFDITVRAMKSADTVNNKYEGKIFFDTNNNPADVVLPLEENDGGSEYQFQAADNGIKLFTKGLTLKKAGTYEIVVFELRGSNGGISKTVQIITKERTGNTVSCSSIAEASSCTRCFRFDLGGSNSANNIFVPRSSIPAGQQEYVDLAKSTISGTTYQGASVSPTGNITNNFDRFASGPNVTASWVWAKTKSGQGVVRGNIPTTVDANRPVYGIRYTTVSHLKNQAAPNAVVPNTEATKVSCDFFFVKAASSVCGNGIREGFEQCDDGNTNGYDSCDNNCKNTGPTISGEVGVGGKLTVSIDHSTPPSRLVLDNTSEHALAIFRFTASTTENLDIDSIKVNNEGTGGKDAVKIYKFYSGPTLLGIVTPDGSGNAELFLSDGTLVIPANDYKLVTVKGILNDINDATFANGSAITIETTFPGGVKATGISSGKNIGSVQGNSYGNTMIAFEAYPFITFATDTSVGSAITLTQNQHIAKISITNPGNKDVTFPTNENFISMYIQVTGDDTDMSEETITLKDQNGTTLDTSAITSATGLTKVYFNTISTGESALTIAAGQTKYFYLYADTSDLEDSGDQIQVGFNGDDDMLMFGINGVGRYQAGHYVFRGGLYGPVLSRSF